MESVEILKAAAIIDREQKAKNEGKLSVGLQQFLQGALTQNHELLSKGTPYDIRKGHKADIDTATGATLIPDDYYQEMLAKVTQSSQYLQLCTGIPCTTNNMKMAVESALWDFTWYDDSTDLQIPSGNPGYEQYLEFPVKDLISVNTYSNQLWSDAGPERLTRIISDQAMRAAGRYIDAVGFVGVEPTDPATGALHAAANVVTTTANTFDPTYAELTQIFDYPAPILQGARWLMHHSVFANILQLTGSTGGSPMIRPEPDGNNLLGYPVSLVDQMPSMADSGSDTRFILFGNSFNIYYADRQVMQLMISDLGPPYFKINSRGLRFSIRLGFPVWTNAATATEWLVAFKSAI